MSDFPIIKRAIPLQRYRVGEYGATLLGEVESGEAVDYRYILAFVEEGEAKPTFFVCCEKNPSRETEGAYRLRVVSSAMSEVLGASDAWKDADSFVSEGLKLGMQALGLTSEQPYRVM